MANSVWISGPQTVPNSIEEQAAGLAKFGAGVGALALLGNTQFGDKRGWDYIANAARHVEEYSPGHIFRTFQISHALSAFETPAQQMRFVSPEIIAGMMGDEKVRDAWSAHMKHIGRIAGRDVTTDLIQQGYRFEGGKLYLGKTGGDILATHAGVVRATPGAAPQLQMGYMRGVAGGTLYEGIKPGQGPQAAIDAANFEKKVGSLAIPFEDAAGKLQSEVWMTTGGQSQAQNIWRKAAGHGSAAVERFNQLARSPADIEPAATIKRKTFLNRIELGVVPSTGLKTLAKFTAKLGVLGTAAWLGYQETDHLVRNTSLLDNTIFDQGITAAIGTGIVKTSMALSKIAEFTGGHDYREWQEDVAPGSTELSKLVAFPLMGALGGLGIGYGQRIVDQFSLQRSGMSLEQASLTAGSRDLFFREAVYGDPAILKLQNKKKYEISQEILGGAEDTTLKMLRDDARIARQGHWGDAAAWMAKKQSSGSLSGRVLSWFGEMSPTKMKTMVGAAVGAALIAPFLPGALVSSERPEELEALYSGKQEVAIKKGRWWEFGRSPYEGEHTSRFREHWYPRMLARGKEKAIWGEDAPGPISRWFTENFTYDLERKHYKDRPYPITGTFGEDIPFVGPIIGATIGRLIKPAKLMHTDEWMGGEGAGQGPEGTVRRSPLKFGQREEMDELGEIAPGAPISPYSAKGIIGEQVYRMTEMIGLWGFELSDIKQKTTGSPDWFDQEQQLESARRMYGAEREYWDMELGGGVGTTELIRRLVPHKRNQIDLYNPIRNTMPDWLPGAGDKGPDFLHGDPYVKVVEGEIRLPGVGYAALNTDMKGVAPEDYSLIHQYKILADVAPYTRNFAVVAGKIQASQAAGQLSREDLADVTEVKRQMAAKRKKKDFQEYKYRDKELTPWAQAIEDTRPQKDPGLFASLFGGYWETLAHNAETPLEYLTPVSPGAKLVHTRTAIEDYAKEQVWGTTNAFWGNPIRDFLTPLVDSTAHAVGWDGIPDQVDRKRDVEEYFDILKWVKYTKLEKMAKEEGESKLARQAGKLRRETLFGVNPYTFNFAHIYRSLPRRERDYFREFSDTKDTEDRAAIAAMVPENERAMYLAKWKTKDVQDIKSAIDRGLLSSDQVEEAELEVNEYYENLKTEGFPKTPELWQEYLANRMQGESYPDWYRRAKELTKQLEGRPLPGPNWVGWHPAVDLQDIKLKVVQNMGESTFDYDIWPDQIRSAAHRPYLQEAADALEGTMSESQIRANIKDLLEGHGVTNANIVVQPTTGRPTVDIRVAQDRMEDAAQIAHQMEA